VAANPGRAGESCVSEERATAATIHLGAIRHNFGEALRRAEGRGVIGVVKADAYGHGAAAVARTLVAAGCGRLAVLSVAEAASLRGAGVEVPILVLAGVYGAEEAETAVELGLTPVVHHARHQELLVAAARARERAIPVHVEVDTGMRRMGAPPAEAPALLESLAGEPALRLEGVFTHFARADESGLEPSLEQLVVFRRVLETARERGVDPGVVHAANSAGLLADEELAKALPEAGAVRPGLMLYGVRPAPHNDADLRPAMTLRARVVHVRRLRPGDSVGYGALFRARRAKRVATLALGYADGVPVAASNRGRVLIRGRRMPIAGRVSMDYVSVDCGDEAVSIGDEAVLFGESKGVHLPVEEAARAAGTIAYELLVRVGARVPRVVVE
jgi:alanine racemase